MKQTHAGMVVTAAEFDAQVEVLVATLDHFEVPQAEQEELFALLSPMRDDIVKWNPGDGDAASHVVRQRPAAGVGARLRPISQHLPRHVALR